MKKHHAPSPCPFSTRPPAARRLLRRALPAALLVLTVAAARSQPADPAAAAQRAPWAPQTLFLQAGAADHVQSASVGATWAWGWQRATAWGRLGGHWEASLGGWRTQHAGRTSQAAVSQLGLTPVLRLVPDAWGGDWFVEGGIGLNLVATVYRSREKRFSTVFNFGDHLAVGRRFGDGRRHELALRLQHYSNAGIRHPNPGQNFVQLRYALEVP